jgi:glyoxylase-like metal-dependent hydrolase (beta-lactamase superfamily II)
MASSGASSRWTRFGCLNPGHPDHMIETDVAPGVHRVEDAFTNWYLVEEDGRLTVVDAGVPTSWNSLVEAVQAIGRRLDDIEAVALTHAHFDHIGFAERARRELGVSVWVHENDFLLTRRPRMYGRERSPVLYLTKPRALPIIAALVRARAFWPSPIEEVRRYTDGELPVPGAPRVVFTPGHTLGACALHLPGRDVVIAGDTVVTLNPYTGSTGPQIVARAATADSKRAMASLDALADTDASIVLTGHGDVWRDGAAEIVRRARAAGTS